MSGLSEDDIIAVLAAGTAEREDVLIGIGDDGSVLAPPVGKQLVTVLDTLNEGVHFPAGIDAAAIGHRALAVNLSDLAAMGAEPAWAALSLSLPASDAEWVRSFARGFHSLAARWGVALVGGDTVRGPLSVAVHLTGFVEPAKALTRGGARPGDLLFVTGTPGEAMAGLDVLESGGSESSTLVQRFLWPAPRVAEGQAIAGLASAAIDLSDGLLVDLSRVAAASGVSIVVEVDDLPASAGAIEVFGAEEATRLAICGGDDYELAFTVPEDRQDELMSRAAGWTCPLARIGRVESGTGVEFRRGGRIYSPDVSSSWSHFSGDSC